MTGTDVDIPPPARRGLSRFGVASLLIWICCLPYWAYALRFSSKPQSAETSVITDIMIVGACFLCPTAGIVLGIIGCRSKTRNRSVAIVGLVLNLLFFLCPTSAMLVMLFRSG